MHEPFDSDVATAEPAAPGPVAQAQPPAPQALAPSFTGSGKEYFRIWIVNLLLTIATLGIYSAWAKVRRLQYFYRNTELAGASFDFNGDPRAILKGRVLAVVLLLAYHYAFGFTVTVGVAIIFGLVLGLPFLMRAALRFRLSNTTYRGLPFGFSGSLGGAYVAYLPPVALFLVPGVLVVVDPTGMLAAVAVPLWLAWPAMHGTMKRYQHQHVRYGNQPASYDVKARRFYKPYLVAFLLILGGGAATALLVGAGAAIIGYGTAAGAIAAGGEEAGQARQLMTVLFIALPMYVIFLLAGPYMQVRIANLVLSNTSFNGLSIRSTMTVRGMMRIQVVNTLLTLVTLGLYRPFAVVRTYQYRVAHLALDTAGGFEDVAASARDGRTGASGDAAADFMGVDISW